MIIQRFNVGRYPLMTYTGESTIADIREDMGLSEEEEEVLRTERKNAVTHTVNALMTKPAELAGILREASVERPLGVLSAHGYSTREFWKIEDGSGEFRDVKRILEEEGRNVAGWVLASCNSGRYTLSKTHVPVIYSLAEGSLVRGAEEGFPWRVTGTGGMNLEGTREVAMDYYNTAREYTYPGIDELPEIVPVKRIREQIERGKRRIAGAYGLINLAKAIGINR
ncbi:hypothetical protein COU61_01915 [Candidatus Pacearchaeota archaeon CG10_big_fil_rev_8_21_14_0_10_35_13]|nr:MAG: hypothetical protein COU61_01915 [Candidatus Pacearchaeota archaeon CG10_big_fil_rev_8_21_14_0_10_35_13]